MQNSKLRHLIIVFFVCHISHGLNAQFIEGDHRFNTRIGGLVPHPISSKGFKNTFIGVYSVSGSQNVHLFKNFYAGICGSNTLYKIPTNKLVSSNGYKLDHMFQLNSAGVNVGYDYYFSPTGFLSTTITVGQCFGKFTSLQTITPTIIHDKFQSSYIQLSSNINFIIEDHFGIGFILSYTYVNYAFNPYDIALNQFKSYKESELQAAISFFEAGFNIYFGYGKRK